MHHDFLLIVTRKESGLLNLYMGFGRKKRTDEPTPSEKLDKSIRYAIRRQRKAA